MTFAIHPSRREGAFRCAVAIGCLMALAQVACEVIGPSDQEPVAVIQALLTVGQSQHVIYVTWSVPADSPFTFQGPPRPVDPAQVSLRLIEPGGSIVPVTSLDTNVGSFQAIATIQAQSTYRLEGEVAGKPISARVLTPGEFVIQSPASDTVRMSSPEHGLRSVPYQWHVPGATAFSTKAFLATITAESDSTGRITFSLAAGDTVNLSLIAYEQYATAFFFPKATQRRFGNIAGSLGVLGAVSITNRVFIWQ